MSGTTQILQLYDEASILVFLQRSLQISDVRLLLLIQSTLSVAIEISEDSGLLDVLR